MKLADAIFTQTPIVAKKKAASSIQPAFMPPVPFLSMKRAAAGVNR
ncbi:hypothetical protein [Xylophilus ampelinus]|nr:hypothetical protein [Xylophilus ampelinus]MCS4510616.1 hypothetical protein [Xylophilus ampelinus]